MDTYYKPVSTPPKMSQGEYDFRAESQPVLGVFRNKEVAVVKATYDYDDQCSDQSVQWFTCCSEGWDVTDNILYWGEIPSIDGLDLNK